MKKHISILFGLICIITLKAQCVSVEKCSIVTDTTKYHGRFFLSYKTNAIPLLPPNPIDFINISNKYFINLPATITDTIQVITELLNMEGDNRLLCIPITGNSTVSSTIYTGTNELSVQVYALYLIWGLFYEYRTTAAYPVLVCEGKRSTVNGDVVREAFESYRKWFDENRDDLMRHAPLYYSNVKWLF